MTLTAIVAMGWSLYEASDEARESSQWVNHTHEVLESISSLEQQVSRAESGLRGYLVSGNASFLIERDAALTTLGDHMAQLQGLVADMPEQKARAKVLEDLVAKRVALMDETVRQHETGARALAADLIRATQEASARIDGVTREMREVEQRLLDERRDRQNRRYDRTMVLLAASALLALCLVVPAYVLFMRQHRVRANVERKLYEMADNIPGVVYRYCSHPEKGSHYEFLSSGIKGLFGVSRAQALADAAVIGNTVLEDDRAGLAAAVAHAAQTLTPLQHEFRVTTPAGDEKWVRSSTAPRPGEDGSIVWDGHWADISEQKRLEQALHEAKLAADGASRAKSSFLAVMSHEIRTPLNGILGMLELLAMTDLDNDQRTTVTVVRESGRSLQRIIDDILDFSKIEAGKLEIACEPASIAIAVESTRNIYLGNASSKGLLLTCSVDRRIGPALVFDPLRLRQILNNLVSNAIKFTSEGSIDIRAELVERREHAETVRLSVSDTGIGMSPQVQARVFEPFAQAGAGTARTFGGTGLGLTISRRLAEMMDGTVELESEPGKGSRVIVTLPLEIADPAELPTSVDTSRKGGAALAPVRSPPSVKDAERERTLVLLVDDHPVNRMLLQRQVNTLGYAAEIASDGVEALHMWKSGRFSIVITDINMPEMDGYELARAIRRLEAARGVSRMPLIACTANALKGEAEACLEAGMDDYLPKPVHLAELQKKLDEWLPLPAARGTEQATSARSGNEPLLDRSALAALTNGDVEAEGEILADFRRVNDDDMEKLESAVAHGDLGQAVHMAHRIKGASRMVGLAAMGAAAERLEHAGRAQKPAAVAANIQALRHELERMNRYVDALRVEEVHR